jgi:hypothetical protein
MAALWPIRRKRSQLIGGWTEAGMNAYVRSQCGVKGDDSTLGRFIRKKG